MSGDTLLYDQSVFFQSISDFHFIYFQDFSPPSTWDFNFVSLESNENGIGTLIKLTGCLKRAHDLISLSIVKAPFQCAMMI